MTEGYTLFNSALTCTDARQLEERFKNLDEVWFEIKGRMQPIHGMEAYADPINIRVNPDYTLTFLDDRQTQLNNQIKETKKITIKYLEGRFGDKEAFAASKKLMENSVAGIYAVLGAGYMNDSGFFGQNVPNRVDVRLKHGVKIFEDLEHMKQTKSLYMEVLTKIFGQNYVNEHFNIYNILNSYAAIYVPSHEIGHNFLIKKETRKSLGTEKDQQLEEHKADLVGTLATTQRQNLQIQQILLQTLLMRSLLKMKERDNASERPYYNIALTHLKTMHEVGVFTERKDQVGWTFDDNPEKIKSFFTKTREIFNELVLIFDTLNTDKAENFINKYYKEEPPFIHDIHHALGLKPRE